MKRIACALLCALMLLTLLASCNGDPKESSGEAYVFAVKGTEISVGADVSPILSALGQWQDYAESNSCYFTGLDKVYTYSGFEIHTYPDGEKDRVYIIRLYDDTVATVEGIRIGSSRDAVKAAYGEPADEGASSLIFRSGDSYLEVFFSGDTVDEIQYQHKSVRKNA